MSNPENEQIQSERTAPAPRKKADSSVLVKGCAIGCAAVAFFLVLLLGGGFWFFWNSVLPKMGTSMSEKLAADFETMKEVGKVPEEHTALYQGLVDYTQEPEATFPTILLCLTIVETNLDDGQVSESELKEAQDVRAFLEANPTAGFTAVETFMNEHEGLKERSQTLANSVLPAALTGAE